MTGRREFGDLSGASPQPVRLQGGVVILRPYGCTYCGQAFWTESDSDRRLTPGPHPCPHCSEISIVPEECSPLSRGAMGQAMRNLDEEDHDERY